MILCHLEPIEFGKKNLISWINALQKNNKIIDVASGTGDIAKLCSRYSNNEM